MICWNSNGEVDSTLKLGGLQADNREAKTATECTIKDFGIDSA